MTVLSAEARERLEKVYRDVIRVMAKASMKALLGQTNDFISGLVFVGGLSARILKDDEERAAAGLPEILSALPAQVIRDLVAKMDAAEWSQEAAMENIFGEPTKSGPAYDGEEERVDSEGGEYAPRCEDCPSRNRCDVYLEYHRVQDADASGYNAPKIALA